LGVIRLESALGNVPPYTTPSVAASKHPPGPIALAFGPQLRVVRVNGRPSATGELGPRLIGRAGLTDLVVPAIGPIQIELETREIPQDTAILVKLKAKVPAGPSVTDSGQRIEQTVLATPCNPATGICTPVLDIDVLAGKWTIETRIAAIP